MVRVYDATRIARWSKMYYELTPTGRKVTTLLQQFIRGSILGAWKKWRFSDGALAVLGYFRHHPNQSRSLEDIYNVQWLGNHVGPKRLLLGIRELLRKGYLRRVK